jgi:DNA-binding SARP family transcriptional activator
MNTSSEPTPDPAVVEVVENISNRFGAQGLCDLIALAREELARAEEALLRLVELAPANGWARRALARTLERQSRADEAGPHRRIADALGAD